MKKRRILITFSLANVEALAEDEGTSKEYPCYKRSDDSSKPYVTKK
jgi:hypothetical protein